MNVTRLVRGCSSIIWKTVSPVEEKSKRLGIPSVFKKTTSREPTFQEFTRTIARKCGRKTEHRLTRSLVNPQQDRTMSTELRTFKFAEHCWNPFRLRGASQNVLIALPVLRSALPIWNWSEMSDTSRATSDQSTAIMFSRRPRPGMKHLSRWETNIAEINTLKTEYIKSTEAHELNFVQNLSCALS